MLCSLLRCLVVSASLVVLLPAPYRALIGELVSMSSSVVWLVRAGEATRQQRVQAASCFQPSSCIYWLVVPCGRLVPHELGHSPEWRTDEGIFFQTVHENGRQHGYLLVVHTSEVEGGI